jgi:6-phosphogluconolactonase (cycloisomerase 2 family)
MLVNPQKQGRIMSIRTTLRSRQSAFRILALCVALASTALLSGCGAFFHAVTTTTTTTNSGSGYDIVYAGKNSSAQIVGYAVSSTGLSAVTGSPYTIASNPLAMAITPNNNYLYVGTAAGIYGYSIAAGGALTALNSGAVLSTPPTYFSPASMDVSPDGNWLMVLNNTSSENFYFYAITTSTGLISATPSAETYVPSTANGGTPVARMIKFSPVYSGSQYIFAASFGSGGEQVFSFVPTANTPIAMAGGCYPTSAANSDNGVAFNSTGTNLYFVRGGGAAAMIALTVNPTTGVIASCTTPAATAATGANPSALTFNQAQSNLYVANAGDGNITGYSVAGPPAFSLLPSSPYSTVGTSPQVMEFDNSGLYILAMNQSGPVDLVQYTVDTTTATAGRLYITSSVNTTLSVASSTVGPGITMVTTH